METTIKTRVSSSASNGVKALAASGGSAKAASKNPSALFLLMLMVLQNSSTVLVGRYTRSVPAEDRYEALNLVVVTEIGKLLVSCVLEHRTMSLPSSIRTHILSNPLDFLIVLIPALLYLIQNTLLYVALSNLSAPFFQVTYQMKTLTTAIVSVLMLNRRYNVIQWFCLVGLGIGVAVVVTGENGGNSAKTDASMNMVVGLTAVSVACFSSALAGVYFEKVLKRKEGSGDKPPVSLWMRNIQLAFFSICIGGMQILSKSNSESKPFLHGFTPMVRLLIFLQVAGGLLVAAIIKYADNVVKGLATGVSVVTSTFCSMLIFGTPLTTSFAAGGSIILGSVYLFSTRGDKPKTTVKSPDIKEDELISNPKSPKVNRSVIT